MAYGRGIRPRWSTGRIFVSGTMLSTAGFGWGFKQKLDAHRKFVRTLENPAGFNRALQGVNLRLGGPTPWNYGVPVRDGRIDESSSRTAPDIPNSEFQEERDSSSTGLWDTTSASGSSVSPAPIRPSPQPSGTHLVSAVAGLFTHDAQHQSTIAAGIRSVWEVTAVLYLPGIHFVRITSEVVCKRILGLMHRKPSLHQRNLHELQMRLNSN